MSGPSSKRSKTMSEAVSCTGKVGFAGYTQAMAVVNRVKTKERPGRSAYQCGYCGMWHLGSDSGRVERKRSAEFKERKRA